MRNNREKVETITSALTSLRNQEFCVLGRQQQMHAGARLESRVSSLLFISHFLVSFPHDFFFIL